MQSHGVRHYRCLHTTARSSQCNLFIDTTTKEKLGARRSSSVLLDKSVSFPLCKVCLAAVCSSFNRHMSRLYVHQVTKRKSITPTCSPCAQNLDLRLHCAQTDENRALHVTVTYVWIQSFLKRGYWECFFYLFIILDKLTKTIQSVFVYSSKLNALKVLH